MPRTWRLLLRFEAYGVPVSQGNHRIRPGRGGGRGKIYESTKGHAVWRSTIRQWADLARKQFKIDKCNNPIKADYHFFLPCTAKSHVPGEYVKVRPDLSKLVRAVEDSISDVGIWVDDGRVAVSSETKRYCMEGQEPGVRVELFEWVEKSAQD